ncbi:MAG: hypothetical protein A4E55_02353 [Pelotomaculum sp. PtaU1.Bin035]|nr:MAG: hypothetical protein A4E55_02353 [Pelotomaculum sp. PtaU1.Bin035]
MNKPWFDSETDILLLDEYIAEMPSFKKILADGVVEEQEITEQVHKVISLMKRLEAMLSPEAKDVTTDIFCELAVLYAIERKYAEKLHSKI